MVEEKVTRSKGVVTKFNDQKGYRFIQPDEGGEDLFVHQTAVKSDGFRTLREGQIVEFMIILGSDKTKAVDVTALGGGLIGRGSNRNIRDGAAPWKSKCSEPEDFYVVNMLIKGGVYQCKEIYDNVIAELLRGFIERR